MADTLTLAYCLHFGGEHFSVNDLIKITTKDQVLVGRLDKITSNSIVLDCSTEHHSKMVSMPIASIVKASSDLTISTTPMIPLEPSKPIPDKPTGGDGSTDGSTVPPTDGSDSGTGDPNTP